MMWIVVIFALLLIFFIIFGGGWSLIFGKGLDALDDQISFTGDKDNDGVINGRDKCPCDPGEIENDGCRLGQDSGSKECLKEE